VIVFWILVNSLGFTACLLYNEFYKQVHPEANLFVTGRAHSYSVRFVGIRDCRMGPWLTLAMFLELTSLCHAVHS
jgi:hypothetical protein